MAKGPKPTEWRDREPSMLEKRWQAARKFIEAMAGRVVAA